EPPPDRARRRPLQPEETSHRRGRAGALALARRALLVAGAVRAHVGRAVPGADRVAQLVQARGLLPGEVLAVAAEVAVGRRLPVDRPAQLELLDQHAGARIEHPRDRLAEALV